MRLVVLLQSYIHTGQAEKCLSLESSFFDNIILRVHNQQKTHCIVFSISLFCCRVVFPSYVHYIGTNQFYSLQKVKKITLQNSCATIIHVSPYISEFRNRVSSKEFCGCEIKLSLNSQ